MKLIFIFYVYVIIQSFVLSLSRKKKAKLRRSKTKLSFSSIFTIDSSAKERTEEFIEAYEAIKNNVIGAQLISSLYVYLKDYPNEFFKRALKKEKSNKTKIVLPIDKGDFDEYSEAFQKIRLSMGEKSVTKEGLNKLTQYVNWEDSDNIINKYQLNIQIDDKAFEGTEDIVYDLEKKKLTKAKSPFYIVLAHEMIHVLHFITYNTDSNEYYSQASIENVKALFWATPLNDANGDCWRGDLGEVIAVIGRKRPAKIVEFINENTIRIAGKLPFRFPYNECPLLNPENLSKKEEADKLHNAAEEVFNSLKEQIEILARK